MPGQLDLFLSATHTRQKECHDWHDLEDFGSPLPYFGEFLSGVLGQGGGSQKPGNTSNVAGVPGVTIQDFDHAS